MIKLCKEDLQVLDRASDIIKELVNTSSSEEDVFELYMTRIKLEGIILKQLRIEEKGVK